ncbi:MAG: SDR family oxidoreductase, partial [Anaerolineaceae bacterium]
MKEEIGMGKVILITGCSTGIGRHLAQSLSQAGETVIATARNVESMADLDAALKLSLDVTQPESVQKAMDASIRHFGRIDVLVNNAGYAQIGAIEELTDEQIRQMYEVNVFGMLRVVRAVAPQMRKQDAGRIINISSIAGRMATPVNGAYSSTKFALEALSDALRWELAAFNIQVVLIEPGAIKTNFDQTVHMYGDSITTNPKSPYLAFYRKHQQVSDGMRRNEPGPGLVYAVVQQALKATNPKPRYLAGVDLPGKIVMSLRDLLWDRVVQSMFIPDEGEILCEQNPSRA